jgi:hypothetical protein
MLPLTITPLTVAFGFEHRIRRPLGAVEDVAGDGDAVGGLVADEHAVLAAPGAVAGDDHGVAAVAVDAVVGEPDDRVVLDLPAAAVLVGDALRRVRGRVGGDDRVAPAVVVADAGGRRGTPEVDPQMHSSSSLSITEQ